MLPWIVFGTGVLSLLISFAIGIRFAMTGWAVGIALAMEKAVDALNCLATLIFSTNALATGSNDVDMYVASALRMVIFVPSALVGLHLYFKASELSKIQKSAMIGSRFADDYSGLTHQQLIEEMDKVLGGLQDKRLNRVRQRGEVEHG